MSLSDAQMTELLKPLEAHRVHRDGKGYSHVEAWDVRRRMNQIFGIGCWDADTTDMQLIFEHEREGGKPRYDVSYRARVRVKIHDTGAVFAEWAAGDARNFPDRGEAHDQAIKTAESQAFKRACVNLGDQFGLSLYKDGSLDATVGEVVGQVHEDSDRVPDFIKGIQEAMSWPELQDVAVRISNARIGMAEKTQLREAYGYARTRIEADQGPEPD
jgi:hypothetical protein